MFHLPSNLSRVSLTWNWKASLKLRMDFILIRNVAQRGAETEIYKHEDYSLLRCDALQFEIY
jgi:hypothetical protein